jgi:hypothetical protein
VKALALGLMLVVAKTSYHDETGWGLPGMCTLIIGLNAALGIPPVLSIHDYGQPARDPLIEGYLGFSLTAVAAGVIMLVYAYQFGARLN